MNVELLQIKTEAGKETKTSQVEKGRNETDIRKLFDKYIKKGYQALLKFHPEMKSLKGEKIEARLTIFVKG